MNAVRKVTLALAAVLFGSLLVAAPSSAATPKPTSTICKGFSACESAGRSTHGYAPVYKQSYWYMLTGHNCTNYVAYRLTHNGRMTSRPEGTDDGGTWGTQAAKVGIPVATTPKVGDIAWWPRNYHGVGSLGHVAYVERVYSDGSVLISEDSYQDTFYYKRVYRGNAYWPKGFIRYPSADGSPTGRFSATATNRPGDDNLTIKTSGFVTDPDVVVADPTVARESLRVEIIGIEGTSLQWSKTYANSVYAYWNQPFSVPQGVYTVTYTALNENLGSDTVLGTKTVRVSDPTKTTMSVTDYDYRYGGRPYVKGTVANTADPTEVYPVGTVTVKDGTKVLTTKTITAASKGVMASYRLPSLSKGKHTIRVSFVPASSAFKSSTAYKYVTVH
ncbi:hypothetical protein ASE12_03115 [Aeromicrobium sp. Root236]|uniref:CHAP domain-containing protein n=1 Tax=Aeromicrobium sp. Root236 TaxID=1736498 RepID=UPI0006F99298|nr:CHAP domain-containing protein [Aeromicrobium sp. Root236]KRC63842.1 hypothetical protein ASE12_03115 [Aeromicrobium sp. Root236]